MKCVRRSTKAFGMGLVVVLVLAACEEASFSYSNPLDPEVDASVSDVLDRVEDPDLRRAIVESAGGDSSVSKRELHWVHAPSWDGYDINSLQGLEFFPNIDGLELYGASGLTVEDYAVLGRLTRLNGLVLGGAALNDQDLIQLGTSLGEGIDWIQLR